MIIGMRDWDMRELTIFNVFPFLSYFKISRLKSPRKIISSWDCTRLVSIMCNHWCNSLEFSKAIHYHLLKYVHITYIDCSLCGKTIGIGMDEKNNVTLTQTYNGPNLYRLYLKIESTISICTIFLNEVQYFLWIYNN